MLPDLVDDDLRDLDRRVLGRLLALGQRVVTELDPTALLPLVAAYAREVVDADLLVVPMVSPDRRTYDYVAADGDGAELVLGQRFPSETGACGWVMEHRRPLLFGLGAAFELAPDAAWEPGLPSSLVVPLIARGRVTGGLAALGKRGGGGFDRADLAVLTVFANLAAVAVDNAHLFDALGAAQRAAEESARENATLLKEIHHRVKNNLQIVSSLLTLHDPAMVTPEGRALLADCAGRIRSMALVHEQLYGGSTFARVDLGSYARELVDGLHRGLAPHARIESACERVEVSLDHAVPLGLILNEAMTNAFKYGLRDVARRPGPRTDGPAHDVHVRLRLQDREVALAVEDHGPGLPAGFDPAGSPSLGMKLIRSLARQLRGRVSLSEGPGLRFEFRCSLDA